LSLNKENTLQWSNQGLVYSSVPALKVNVNF
jgi:hypothetical protein